MDKTTVYEDFINLFDSLDQERDLIFHEKLALLSLYEITKYDLSRKLSKLIIHSLFNSNGIQIRKISKKEIEILKMCPGFTEEDLESIRYNNILIKK